MHSVLQSLRHMLIVSCQAFPGDPLDDTETLRRMARSAVLGGASGLRLNGPEDIRAVRQDTDLPIIGLQKHYTGGELRITPDFASARALAKAGATIIALDCTGRRHAAGEPWQQIVRRIHDELHLLVMADIATLQDGLAAAEAGADILSPTLRGYTEETKAVIGFDPGLIAELVRKTGRVVFAEGNVDTPAKARQALEAGAWSVVVGSAITRPGVITERFVRTMASPSQPAYAVGLDIGGTAIKAAIVDQQGQIVAPCEVPTQASAGREAIAASLAEALQETLRAADDAGYPLAGIGIASAGAIDSRRGVVFAATDNLPGWAGFDLGGFVGGYTRLPVAVENDAQAAALAELYFGAGRGLFSFVAITLGTGVGGGIVADGKLLRGQHGFAGTIGHQTVRVGGKECNCGRRGCLEAYVSTTALIQNYATLMPAFNTERPLPEMAREIGLLAAAADANARRAYSQMGEYLVEGLANLFNVLDPDALILSGGLLVGQSWFLQELRGAIESALHFGEKRRPVLLEAQAGRYAGVQGAAAGVLVGRSLECLSARGSD